MRIALFWVDFLHYHVARIQAASQLAAHRGYEVIPIAVRPGSPEFPVSGYQNLLNVPLRILADSSQTGDMHSCRTAQQMIKALTEIGPNAVAIAGYDSRVALTALSWCRRNRRGAILMSDSQQNDFRRTSWKETVKRRLVSCFDSALTAGSLQIRYLTALGMSPERIFVGYDVVDNDFWGAWADHVRQNPQTWRESLRLPQRFFLTASRLVPKKNVAGLLRSYARYATQIQGPWPLVIVGDGPLRSDLEDLAHSLGVAQSVRFMGYLSSEQMGPVYGLATVFILASAYSEQWGLVVNEAMSAGLPVLVSKICGCVPDLVLESSTGYTFDPADEADLAALLAKCSRGVFDLNRLGQIAQQHIQAYSPQTFAENLIASAEAAVIHARNRRVHGWPLPLVLP